MTFLLFKLEVIEYGPLLDNIGETIKSWPGSSLSHAGRLQLLRAIIQGKSCYWLSIFNIPSAVIYRIERMCSIFLWGAKLARVTWKDLCFPKSEGGLGCKDLKTWNRALICKELWSIHLNKETLWVQWVHSFYLVNESIWEWSPPTNAPPFLKAIIGVRELLLQTAGSVELAIAMLSKCCIMGQFCTSLVYELFRKKTTRVVREGIKFIWVRNNNTSL